MKDSSLNLRIFSLLLVVICEADDLAPCLNGHACTDGAYVYVSRLLLDLSAMNVVAPFTGSLCNDSKIC